MKAERSDVPGSRPRRVPVIRRVGGSGANRSAGRCAATAGLLLALALPAATVVSPNREELAASRHWAARHLETGRSAKPFAFNYGGHESAEFLASWPTHSTTRTLDRTRTARTLTWADPNSGLRVRCDAVIYRDFPAVEWTTHFTNAGTSATLLLQDVQGLDASFQRGGRGEFTLHGLKGDFCTADSYEPYQHVLPPNAQRRFGPSEGSGKSCDGPEGWPYYNLEIPGEGGVMLAVGWPGQWASAFTRDAARGLRVTAGQQRTHLVLEPGEAIRTPLIALLFWKGEDRVRAQNLWRRWFIAHNLARTRGQTQPPIAQIQVEGSVANIASVKAVLDAGIRPDVCWRDAGGAHTWYPNQNGPYQGNDAWLNTGTWEVDPARYPQGFKPFSDWVRARGMQFLLWFEPERVGDPTSWLATHHSEWLLPGSSHGAILNLGHPGALAWLVDHLDAMIRTQGLDWYREDMNGVGPLLAWRRNDAEHRQGITENLHVQGHLALWDELRRRHAGLRIDSCASGGRRNDLESMRRAVPLLRSDFQFPDMKGVVEGNQAHTYGLSFWLPFQGTGCYLYDTYAFRSFYLPSFGMGALNPATFAAQKQAYTECRRIAPLMLGDYYPLTPYSRATDRWIAWQFNRPEQRDGCVQAFRRPDCMEATLRVRLHGLAPRVRYEVENLDGGTVTRTGRELISIGLLVESRTKPAALVFVYRRAGSPDRT